MLKIFVRINKDFYAFENYNIIFFSNRLIYNLIIIFMNF